MFLKCVFDFFFNKDSNIFCALVNFLILQVIKTGFRFPKPTDYSGIVERTGPPYTDVFLEN